MAAGGSSYAKTQGMRGFITLLTSAACEWLLILLLLIDALLSYLLKKFASYCELQAPCILCSRLDGVLDGENPELYQTLLCSNHRLEISSLISCHIHSKVADGRGMCDDCLLSFTTKTKANPKSHRLLVGKLRQVHGGCDFQRDLFAGSMGSRPCTCCGKMCKPGHSAQRSFQLQPLGSEAFSSCIPLPRAPRQSHLNNCHNSKFCGSSYDGFSELKLISDSDSEFPFSDDDDDDDEDDIASVISENNEAGGDSMCQCTSVISSKFLQSRSNQEELEANISSPNPKPSLLDPCIEPDICKHHDVQFLDSDFVNDYGLFEINWQQVNQKSFSSHLPKLNSLLEASPSPNAVNISKGESEKRKSNCCPSDNFLSAALSELMTLDGTCSFVEASPLKPVDVSQASDNGLQSVKNHEEDLKKISTRARAFKETGLIEEEVERVKEELKLLSSHNFSPRGPNMSLVSPLNDPYLPETQANASSSNRTWVLQKSVSVDSGLGSLAGSNVDEIERESLVDQLKRQIAYDKKCMSSLYKELEEERNASAIATNQAMAMITRLQEEKAALHMESLQYLRMMEEQAEHDAHALEKAEDLLSEKEKEIQDLEAELEFYRLNWANEPIVENMQGETLKEENITVQNASVPHITHNINTCNSEIRLVSQSSDETVAAQTPCIEFEEEKLYISQWLKNLEMKLRQISSSNKPNGRLEKLEESKSDGFSNGECPQLNGQTEETDMSVLKKLDISNGSLADQDGSVSSDIDCYPSKENNHCTFVGPKSSMHKREVDLVALENEISELNDKLEALKADRDLLECILKSLQDKNNLQLVQEIACQLHELRKI